MMSKKKILILDDEENIRLSLKDFLEDDGFEIVTSESSEDALKLVTKFNFDLAIVDIRLPGEDGSTFIKQVHDLSPNLKYIIHTGSVQYEIPPSLKVIGLRENNIVYKPIKDLYILLDKINRLLNS